MSIKNILLSYDEIKLFRGEILECLRKDVEGKEKPLRSVEERKRGDKQSPSF